MSAIEERLRDLGAEAHQAPGIDEVIQRGQRIRRQRRSRRIAVVAGTVAAALLVVPVIGHRPYSTSAASDFLNTVADRAAAQQAADASKAAYWYAKSEVVYDGKRTTRQIWLGHYAAGRLIDSDGPTSLDVAIFPAGSSSVTWDQLFALPRDPDTLYEWLRAAVGSAGHDVDSEMFVAVGDLLRESPAPPSLRQALYKVAAKIPNVELTPGVKDALGRQATVVSRANPEGTGSVRYFIDASNGALLQEQDINADGSTGFMSTFVVAGPVTTPTAIPRG
jgi:hypothetical protein